MAGSANPYDLLGQFPDLYRGVGTGPLNGLSMRDLLRAIGYRRMRSSVAPGLLASYLLEHPKCISAWQGLSDDKRTDGGYYLDTVAREVGRYESGRGYVDRQQFASAHDACADFILRELDCWDGMEMRDSLDGMPLESVVPILVELVSLLAAAKYDDLLARCSRSRLSAEQLNEAIHAYGRTPIALPEEGLALVDAIRLADAAVPSWSVNLPVWTKEEGRSDLTLLLTVTIREGGPGVELDDLRVL